MATIIEVSENKMDCLTECVEKILRYSGKLMQIVEDIEFRNYDMKGGHEDSDMGDYHKNDEEDYYGRKRSRRTKPEYPRYY